MTDDDDDLAARLARVEEIVHGFEGDLNVHGDRLAEHDIEIAGLNDTGDRVPAVATVGERRTSIPLAELEADAARWADEVPDLGTGDVSEDAGR